MPPAEPLSDAEIDEALARVRAGEARLGGGATSDGMWFVIWLDGGFQMETSDERETRYEELGEDRVRGLLRMYGRRIVLPA